MKKIIFAMFIAVSVFAGVKQIDGYSEDAVYHQFTHDSITDTGNWTDTIRSDQNWEPAQMITLKISAKMDVWISNYVSSWYDPKPLLPLNGNVYDMDAGYGIVQTNSTGTVEHVSGNGGDNLTSTVTYFHDANPSITNSTEAYFLGSFNAGDEIGIWLTTLAQDGGEQVDTQQYVQDADHNTTLVSRIDDYVDLAGNVRINFGINSPVDGLIAREWVAVGVIDDEPVPMGAPLPGVMMSCLVGIGGFFMARKKTKRG